MRSTFQVLAALTAVALLLSACQQTPAKPGEPVAPDYTRPLPPGANALRKLRPDQIPDMSALLPQLGHPDFRAALARSVAWYAKPSAAKWFPRSGISHAQAKASAEAFEKVVAGAAGPEAALAEIKAKFDVYESVGWDGSGTVLFTGYHSPIYPASLTPDATFKYPIYKRPADLPMAGQDTHQPPVVYPSRAELQDSGKLKGLELAYFADPYDAYAVEVNGSARLRLPDGRDFYIGYAGVNGHEYVSIGKALIESGKIPASKLSVASIKAYFKAHPEEFAPLSRANPRQPFFTEYAADSWPAGCLGFPVTARRSLAADKSVFPPGAVTWVRSGAANRTGPIKPIDQLMTDQDAGGAIRAPGRSDLYFGWGPEAEHWAGELAVEGRLYYFFLKDGQ